MTRRPESNFSAEQVHYIRSSQLSSTKLAAELGVNVCTVRRARHGHTFADHPTPPVKLKRGGWKKPQPVAPFEPDTFSLPGEEWRPVVCWERYYRVSSLGRVYSLHQTGRLVIGMPVEGYRVLKVRDKERRGHLPVHCMVLEAFVGPRPSTTHEGCHDNGEPSDNRLSNLRWDTAVANQADRIKHGTSLKGKPMFLRLTAEVVHQIRTAGKTDMYWAALLKTTRGTIQSARTGKTWQEVETPPDIRRRVPGGRYQTSDALRASDPTRAPNDG